MSLKLVQRISEDILPTDIVSFGLQISYRYPVRAYTGVVMDHDTPDGQWDVNVNGAIFRVYHRQIYMLEQSEIE